MIIQHALEPLSSIAYALITSSVIASLFVHAIWDCLKDFGYVSAIRYSSTNCRLTLCVQVTQNISDLFHTSWRRCRALVIQRELCFRCIQLYSKRTRRRRRRRVRRRRRAGSTWNWKWIFLPCTLNCARDKSEMPIMWGWCKHGEVERPHQSKKKKNYQIGRLTWEN